MYVETEPMFLKEKLGQLFWSQRHFGGKFSVKWKGCVHWASQYCIETQHYLSNIPLLFLYVIL